jgi:hypothetical protein
MQDLPPGWQPQVGERVGIRGSRLLGTVERIEGPGAGARFILKVVAPPDDDVGAVYVPGSKGTKKCPVGSLWK